MTKENTMEKKKSVEVKRFGMSFVLIGIIIFAFFLYYSITQFAHIIQLILWLLIPSLSHFVLGIGILKLKSWSLNLLFWILPIGLLSTLFYFFIGGMSLYPNYILGYLLLFYVVFYWGVAIKAFGYFSQPDVKKEFRDEKN